MERGDGAQAFGGLTSSDPSQPLESQFLRISRLDEEIGMLNGDVFGNVG